MKPPMVFSASDADLLADTLAAILAERAGSAQLRARLAAADAARAASHVAPLAAAYADNAARIYALASGGTAAASSTCGSDSDCAAAANDKAATPAKRRRAGSAGGAGGAGSLLRRVMSWASFRSDSSLAAISSVGDWELPAAPPDGMGRPAASPMASPATVAR
jgi:hypothetical protein